MQLVGQTEDSVISITEGVASLIGCVTRLVLTKLRGMYFHILMPVGTFILEMKWLMGMISQVQQPRPHHQLEAGRHPSALPQPDLRPRGWGAGGGAGEEPGLAAARGGGSYPGPGGGEAAVRGHPPRLQ